ncbi:MAG: hypothetical protein U0103_25370 [Candidatus Obscuribacterales bacterium]
MRQHLTRWRSNCRRAGDYVGASQVNLNPPPFGAVISPFTGTPDGPQFKGSTFTGFRWLQSAYLQDKWTPKTGFWKRLTLDGGVRFGLAAQRLRQHYGTGRTGRICAGRSAIQPQTIPDPAPH